MKYLSNVALMIAILAVIFLVSFGSTLQLADFNERLVSLFTSLSGNL